MNNAEIGFDLKNKFFFFFLSFFIQFLIGASIWQLCNNIKSNKNEKKLNVNLQIPLEEEIKQDSPKEMIKMPEIVETELQQQEMKLDEIMPSDPFEQPRLMETPIIPEIKKPIPKKKEIRKEAPKIVKKEIKETIIETKNTVPEVKESESKPAITSPIEKIKEKKEIVQTNSKPALTKSQLNEISKYFSKVMTIFEKNKIYPKNARVNHIEGKIIVSFCVDSNGKTFNVVAKTKTPALLSQSAEELVRKSSLPKPPKYWNNSEKIEIPISYKLK